MKNTHPTTPPDTLGYPQYPASDDIYNQAEQIADADPENPDEKKSPNETNDDTLQSVDHMFSNNLDAPGTEYDDAQEAIGSEDEENNVYSMPDNRENETDPME